MNKIAFLYGAETRRLKKIIHKTRDKSLCRRATAVLLVLKGKAKAEVAKLLQAGRSSVNRWFAWYEAAGIDGLTNQRTGRPPITYVGSTSKSSELFISLMEKLKRQYRRAKTITLVVDNYIIHKSKKTEKWLRKNPKFVLLFQPVCSPWVNKIEKLWRALHETITRNHCCKTINDLLEQVEHFVDIAALSPGAIMACSGCIRVRISYLAVAEASTPEEPDAGKPHVRVCMGAWGDSCFYHND